MSFVNLLIKTTLDLGNKNFEKRKYTLKKIKMDRKIILDINDYIKVK
jgi:hypothetical protein